MQHKYKLGIIGVGVMAGAILSGIERAKALSSAAIILFDADSAKCVPYAAKGYALAESADAVFKNAEHVLLAVKPQNLRQVFESVPAASIGASSLISIMAGVKIDTLAKYLPSGTQIFRVMPNLPCICGLGVAAIAHQNAGGAQLGFVKSIFAASGTAIEIAEDKFDAVTSISGSGPAYVFLFAEALTKAGVEGGLTEAESKALALDTLIGAATLAKSSNESLETLARNVCSKGGTTIEAVNSFNADGLSGTVSRAVRACRERSAALSHAD